MRAPISGICLALLLTLPALAASQRAHDDCNADDPDRNIAGCTRIIEDKTEDRRTRSIAHTGRGLAWRHKGEPERAIEDFTAAIWLLPNDALAYNNRAHIYRELGQNDLALADYDEAIRINPMPRIDGDARGRRHINVYHNRGGIWVKKNELDRAIADFDEAIRRDPTDADVFNSRGSAWAAKSDLDRALADFNEALRLDPRYVYAYMNRGRLWQAKGDEARARADFAAAEQISAQVARAAGPMPPLTLLPLQ
jgi:tetratricopeptide (TPR) repeat protein